MQLLLLVFPLNELFEDLLQILDFSVLAVLEQVVDDRIFQGKHGFEHSFACFGIQWLVISCIQKHLITSYEIDRVLITRGKSFGLAFLFLKLMEEGRVLPSNFDKLVVLQVVEGGVNGESSIDCVLPLSQAVVGIENTTSGQNFKCKLCARVHIQEQLD